MCVCTLCVTQPINQPTSQLTTIVIIIISWLFVRFFGKPLSYKLNSLMKKNRNRKFSPIFIFTIWIYWWWFTQCLFVLLWLFFSSVWKKDGSNPVQIIIFYFIISWPNWKNSNCDYFSFFFLIELILIITHTHTHQMYGENT